MGQNQSKTESFECCVGETIHLQCKNYRYTVEWMFNGKPILSNKHEYKKCGAGYADAGKYECKIDGKVECVFHVNVYNYLFQNDFLGIRTILNDTHSSAGDLKYEGTNQEQKSSILKSSNDSGDCELEVFSMKRNPRGIAVIIGIEKFDNLKDLNGVKKDIENCETTFSQLHFVVKECKSTKAKDIMTFLKNISNMNHNYYDCLIVYISSHGGHGYVCCSDYCNNKKDKNGKAEEASGYIYIDTLIEMFVYKQCKTLQHKPKLFFFDCCRNLGTEISNNTNGSPIRTYKNMKELAKHYGNILIGYATISGTSTSIDANGSYYTNVLTTCMKGLAPKNSFVDVMTQVANTMRKKHNQIAHYESTLDGQIIMKNLMWMPNQDS